ncbi:hypothetical protein HYG87_08400 [Methanobacterium alkalithermotolerans]|uniref:Uncharacterized protein n=1 Tax=Methanobacterium alkalithermotolerans TaxID=2731220 RepID=A0A8T8K6W6_9EURY|nr:hypothetical protein [Methanobacterium alkalithermotolerans]QUH23777.1 hypothetical protein HYG87_08400 [Methanobacterium alkalithermotolerans]RJS48283.1 MAG: hypothetical protein CIT03_09190 [Methanobacterium sp.]
MGVLWVTMKDITGKSYKYSTAGRKNALSIVITEDKITIGLERGEDKIPTSKVFLKSNLIFYEYTSDHLQQKRIQSRF